MDNFSEVIKIKIVLRKIHKSCFSHGSLAECGITAYSPKHIKISWRGVTCKNCLKHKGGTAFLPTLKGLGIQPTIL